MIKGFPAYAASVMSEQPSIFSELDQRSRDIFQALVETYIESGSPVGSRTLSREQSIGLSPASVRNVMSDLEDCGLITSPHTSAGRVPTEMGLRFFVDTLMEHGSVSNSERESIDKQIMQMHRETRVEDVLSEATNLLAGLAKCACVVVAPKAKMRLKHIEFVSLAPGRALVVLVGEDGTVENRAIEVPPGLPPATLKKVSNFLSARCSGKTLAEAEHFVREELAVIQRELDDLSARIVSAGFAEWSKGENNDRKNLIVRGRGHLFDSATSVAEEQELDRLRQLFDDLEAKKDLINLLELAENGEGVRIFIGSENKLFSLSGSSLIMAPYSNGHEDMLGVLGVIGPTRINYARIIPMVDYTAKVISRLLS